MPRALRLDPIRCDGFGICAGLLPERISLDEWGYPLIDPSPIEGHLIGQARRAVDACPLLALSLRAIERPAVTRRLEPVSRA